MIRVDVESLLKNPDRTLEYGDTWDKDRFELEQPEADLVEPVQVEFRLRNDSGIIHAQGHVETVLGLTCSRCLDQFNQSVDSDLAVEYVPEGRDREEPFEQKVYVLEIVNEQVNLSEPIRQELVLNIPMQPLCREDCKSLCSVCGANLNKVDCGHDQESIDPRLEGLQDIEISSDS